LPCKTQSKGMGRGHPHPIMFGERGVLSCRQHGDGKNGEGSGPFVPRIPQGKEKLRETKQPRATGGFYQLGVTRGRGGQREGKKHFVKPVKLVGVLPFEMKKQELKREKGGEKRRVELKGNARNR